MRLFLVMSFSLVLLTACGGESQQGGDALWPAGWPDAAARTLDEKFAPAPYTAEQLREACPSGLRLYYEVEEQPKPPNFVLFAFDRCNEDGLDLVVSDVSPEGKILGVPESRRMSWKEFQGENATPVEYTKMHRETVEVPAGTFDCIVYTVTSEGPDGTVTDQTWFPFEQPGPFVKRVTTFSPEQKRVLRLERREVVADGNAQPR